MLLKVGSNTHGIWLIHTARRNHGRTGGADTSTARTRKADIRGLGSVQHRLIRSTGKLVNFTLNFSGHGINGHHR
jgi:hypothetical protein